MVAGLIGEGHEPELAVGIPLGAVHITEAVGVSLAMLLGDTDGGSPGDAGLLDVVSGAARQGDEHKEEGEEKSCAHKRG